MALTVVGCCNSGIPRENTELKTGSANSVGKSPQPISIPISPNFPEFFPDFVFSRKYGIRSGKSGYGVGRYGIFPFPLSSLSMETNFSTLFLLLSIQSVLHKLLELLLKSSSILHISYLFSIYYEDIISLSMHNLILSSTYVLVSALGLA